jgi:uncharacterized protein with HEPN domain
MPAKDPRLYLIHIRDCCQRILEYTEGQATGWAATPIVLDAVCRNLEIIGEAAGKLDESYRKAHPEIPWRSIIDARNVLIHAYDQIQPHLIQDIVDRDVGDLLGAIRRILGENPP